MTAQMQHSAPMVREHVLNGFEPSLEAPHEARRFVADVLRERDELRLLDDAALIVSELATNAVVHTGSRFEVAVHFEPGTVTLSVSDPSAEEPAIGDPSPADLHGRGLLVVDALARRWGCVRTRVGKCVWAELAR
jgi:anti-sigma regulatory factor (Ser/Thr protein kinase)